MDQRPDLRAGDIGDLAMGGAIYKEVDATGNVLEDDGVALQRWGLRQQFIQTCLERDLPQLGITTSAATMLRFWTMLAHYHGGTWNAAEPARSLGVSQPTVRRYLDILSDLFVVRQQYRRDHHNTATIFQKALGTVCVSLQRGSAGMGPS